MNGIISSEDLNKKSLFKKVKAAASMKGQDLAKLVTCKENYIFKSSTLLKLRISGLEAINVGSAEKPKVAIETFLINSFLEMLKLITI